MHKVQYGTQMIEYSVHEIDGLKSHYISVERHSGVVLKGKPVSPDVADQMILKKAKWIIKKLELVGGENHTDIVTGSRITYLGKSYYAEVIPDATISDVVVEFNYSRFKIRITTGTIDQDLIKAALEEFYKKKAVEKITPRVEKIATKINLPYTSLSFRKMSKRWGSCTADNKIIINIDAVKLPFTLIDYLITHELCHTNIKDHSKAFWAELSKHVPNWKELDERMKEMKM